MFFVFLPKLIKPNNRHKHQATKPKTPGREKNDSAMAGPDVPSVPLERSDPWDFDQNYASVSVSFFWIPAHEGEITYGCFQK